MNKKEIGNFGEEMAKKYFIQEGYAIIAQNFSCKIGEIDLIARRGKWVVFIEVKTRRSQYFGTASESVNQKKQKKIRQVAAYFLAKNRWADIPIRFDVVTIDLSNAKSPKLQHIPQAF